MHDAACVRSSGYCMLKQKSGPQVHACCSMDQILRLLHVVTWVRSPVILDLNNILLYVCTTFCYPFICLVMVMVLLWLYIDTYRELRGHTVTLEMTILQSVALYHFTSPPLVYKNSKFLQVTIVIFIICHGDFSRFCVIKFNRIEAGKIASWRL